MTAQDLPKTLATEFHRERSVRRIMAVLNEKRRRLLEEFSDFAANVHLFLPPEGSRDHQQAHSQEILEEALGRMSDEAFAHWLSECLHHPQP